MNHTRATIDKKVTGRMLRCIPVVCVLLGALGSSPGSASASPDDTVIFHFKGRAGLTVLTDCLLTDPVGTQCRAVSVIAAEEHVKDNGELFGGPGLNVVLLDVTITADAPFFVAEQVGFGRADVADVHIDGFAGGTASATNVPLCDDFPCAPGAQESISVDIEWAGFGPIERAVQHDKSSDGMCWGNTHQADSTRLATSTGTVGGQPWHQTLIPAFAPVLEFDTFGAVQRCT